MHITIVRHPDDPKAQQIKARIYDHTVPFTTRAPRPGEKHGVQYNFVSREEFEAMIKVCVVHTVTRIYQVSFECFTKVFSLCVYVVTCDVSMTPLIMTWTFSNGLSLALSL